MYNRILVPFDGSAPSLLGLEEAIKLAKQCGSLLRVIYQIDELAGATGFESGAVYARDVLPSLRRAGASILEEARGKAHRAGLEIETVLFESEGRTLAARTVEQVGIWNAELIVIGSHGRRGAARMFMGSDAEEILRLAPVPVLIVRRRPVAAIESATAETGGPSTAGPV